MPKFGSVLTHKLFLIPSWFFPLDAIAAAHDSYVLVNLFLFAIENLKLPKYWSSCKLIIPPEGTKRMDHLASQTLQTVDKFLQSIYYFFFEEIYKALCGVRPNCSILSSNTEK